MKKYELLPTEENLLDALCKDTISRNKDIVYFYDILQAQTSASAIAIDGRWGSGKTFFVKQMELAINALNPYSNMDTERKEKITSKLPFSREKKDENENFSIAVYYDAWKNDNDTEPVLSILYEIARQLKTEFTLNDKNIIKIFGAIFEGISGRNVNGIVDALKSEDLFTKFKLQKEVEDNIKIFLSSVLNERGNRLVIFVDELDRCKPSFAIQLLEQIKHYLYDDRITFVFSVNLEQLQHTVKHYYGIDFDSCRYLDRFFDLRIAIPTANLDKFYSEIELDSSYWNGIVCKKIIKMFNFELREITKFYSQVKAATYKSVYEKDKFDFSLPHGKGKQFILIYIVPLLIALRIADVSEYNDFINGKNSEPLRRLLLSDEVKYTLHSMLDKDEAFDEEKGKIIIAKDEVIDRFYDALFVNEYVGNIYSIKLGEYEFTKNSKDFAIDESGMMSDYADLT